MSINRDKADFQPSMVRNKNMLINGSMLWNQRGFSGTPQAGGEYTLDRWFVANADNVSQGENTPFVSDMTVNTGTHSMSINKSADQDTQISQYMPLTTSGRVMDQLNGRTFTLSFWVWGSGITQVQNVFLVRSNSTGPLIRSDLEWQEVLGGGRVLTQNAWNYIELTFTVAFTGQEGNVWAIRIDPANADAGYWALSGVKLEEGAVATPFDTEDFGEGWAADTHYYYKLGGNVVMYPDMSSSTAGTPNRRMWLPFPNVMRTQPAVNWVANNVGTITGTYPKIDGCEMLASAASHEDWVSIEAGAWFSAEI